jgi:hypothetical protein
MCSAGSFLTFDSGAFFCNRNETMQRDRNGKNGHIWLRVGMSLFFFVPEHVRVLCCNLASVGFVSLTKVDMTFALVLTFEKWSVILLLNWFQLCSNSWRVAVNSDVKHTMYGMGMHSMGVHSKMCLAWACIKRDIFIGGQISLFDAHLRKRCQIFPVIYHRIIVLHPAKENLLIDAVPLETPGSSCVTLTLSFS